MSDPLQNDNVPSSEDMPDYVQESQDYIDEGSKANALLDQHRMFLDPVKTIVQYELSGRFDDEEIKNIETQFELYLMNTIYSSALAADIPNDALTKVVLFFEETKGEDFLLNIEKMKKGELVVEGVASFAVSKHGVRFLSITAPLINKVLVDYLEMIGISSKDSLDVSQKTKSKYYYSAYFNYVIRHEMEHYKQYLKEYSKNPETAKTGYGYDSNLEYERYFREADEIAAAEGGLSLLSKISEQLDETDTSGLRISNVIRKHKVEFRAALQLLIEELTKQIELRKTPMPN